MISVVQIRWLGLCCVLAALTVVAAACGGAGDNGGKPGVVATTVQVGALAKAVAGGTVSIKTLVGAGVDPHDYEASADDIKTIGDSKLVLRNGIGLDAFLDKAVAGSGQKNVVTVTDGVPLRKGDQAGSKEDDPHVWHNPVNDKIMVDNIAKALSAAFPANAATYQQNADAYRKRLDAVDAEIRGLIDTLPADNRKMVTNHDAFGYFIERYGLEFVGAVIPNVSTAAEASARQIADLEDTIRREKVRAVFAESSLDPKVAKQIARDTGVKIVDNLYGDSLGPPGSGADTVDGMLLANARTIVDALR
jgi:ABC-type Zn uptake system ZnuABC Zn-binding protein ZnuA